MTSILTLFVALSLSRPGSCLIEMTITQGEDVALNCSFNKSSENKAVWWFKNEIILAESYCPSEVGYDNVLCNQTNGNETYLYIDGFNSANTGIYNCTVGKVSAAEYNLLLKEISFDIFYMGKEINATLQLNQSDMTELQCYTDKMAPGDTYAWRINGLQTFQGVKKSNFSVDERGVVEGSILKYDGQERVSNITCLVGNMSRSVTIIVEINVTDFVNENNQTISKDDTGAPLLDIAMIHYLLYGICGLIVFVLITLVCKKIKNSFPSRGKAKINSTYHVNNSRIEDIEEISSFYGSLPDFENVLINEEPVSRVFARENLCFNRDLPSSLILLYWSGTLTYSRSKVHDVMISYVEGDAPVEAKRLWKTCSDSRLSISEHPNLLKTIGYCKCDGLLFIINDYFEMNTLDNFLVSEYSNFETSGDDYTGYALDIIDGMEYLDSVACAHPGLCARRIVVNHLGICKLYDFCPSKQARDFLEIFLKEDREFEYRLAPEIPHCDDYPSSCDVWGVGMTLWELFFGGHTQIYGIIHMDGYEMKKHLDMIQQPPECPEEIFTAMKMCLSKECDDRPTMNELKYLTRKNATVGAQSSLYIKRKRNPATQIQEEHYVEDPTEKETYPDDRREDYYSDDDGDNVYDAFV